MKKIMTGLLASSFVLLNAQRASCDELQSQHRLVVVELGPVLKVANNDGADFLWSFKLLGYEYINRANWGIEVDPINFTIWNGVVQNAPLSTHVGNTTYTTNDNRDGDSIFYIPVWFKYHFRRLGSSAWPYVGVGVGYHHYDEDHFFNETNSDHDGLTAAGEIGMDMGGRSARHILSLKVFPASSAAHDGALVAFTYSYRWAFGQK